MSPALAGRFFTTEPPGTPGCFTFKRTTEHQRTGSHSSGHLSRASSFIRLRGQNKKQREMSDMLAMIGQVTDDIHCLLLFRIFQIFCSEHIECVLFCFDFNCTVWLVGSSFPTQGSNTRAVSESAEF